MYNNPYLSDVVNFEIDGLSDFGIEGIVKHEPISSATTIKPIKIIKPLMPVNPVISEVSNSFNPIKQTLVDYAPGGGSYGGFGISDSLEISDFENNFNPFEIVSPAQPSIININTRIIDENGEALAGATLKIKGKAIGSTANMKGNVSLQANANEIIEVSFVGYPVHSFSASEIPNVIQLSGGEMLDEFTLPSNPKEKKEIGFYWIAVPTVLLTLGLILSAKSKDKKEAKATKKTGLKAAEVTI